MSLVYDHNGVQIFHGDCRDILPACRTDLRILS